ncbi:MAG TPA: hypothetical protein PLF73_11205, partial [Luteimonas sp.]|nr:hypothetical protein [Luteimonas sp.]
MSLRTLALAGLLVGAIGRWFSPYSPRVPDAPAPVAGADIICPLPSTATLVDGTRQTDLPDDLPAFNLQAGTLTPLAGFSVSARVLGRKDYSTGREADFSPTDLALGWQR